MEEQTKSLTGRIWVAATGVIFLIIFASWIWRAPNRQIPNELVGEWHTTDPNYSERWFEINSVCITFVTGRGSVSTGFIKEVKAVPEGGRILYTISYSVDGTANEVSFYYETTKDNVIRFKHQEKTIWIKDKSG
jgi:hypothetical protein